MAQQEGRGVVPIQLPTVPSFDPSGDPNTISQRWNKWKKSFVYYIEASGITNYVQKRNTLLHLVGIETQKIFETLQIQSVKAQNILLISLVMQSHYQYH